MKKCAFAVLVKISKGSKWIRGIAVGGDLGDVEVIVTNQGPLKADPWDFKSIHGSGMIWFDLE
ncbi:hypothetical protein LCGC14_1712970 [marine sediment metagenome]|uniref:Uncharacterized protein n=1 Tax=marine sediment metagenome TaxID=412755 RepID=A0A0F9KEL9_9ZZZZ